MFSYERFMAVYYPMTYLKSNKYKLYTLSLISFFIYSFSLISSGFDSVKSEQTYCTTFTKWIFLMKLISSVDMTITVIVPFVLITVLNLAIIYKLLSKEKTDTQHHGIRKDSKNSSNNSLNKRTPSLMVYFNYNTNKSKSIASTNTLYFRKSLVRKRKATYFKTTKILLLISFTFLVLNFPIAYCKFRYLFISIHDYIIKFGNDDAETIRTIQNLTSSNSSLTLENHMEIVPFEEILERISCYFYYMNFSLNFFLYVFFSNNFRKNIIKIFKK